MNTHAQALPEGQPGATPLKVTELVLRDAHQSLLATRLKLEDMLPICDQLDNAGYYSLEVWGGATFDVCLRYLNEDPWERLRQLKKALPKTPLQMLFRGQNILGYRHYADDVVRRFVQKSREYGMDIFRIFDALNDPRNMETAVRATVEVGGHAQGTICYTISSVHTLEKFVELGRQLEDMGCHSIVVKDMAALLTPVPAYQIVRALKETVKIPIFVHTHATTGVAAMVLMRAADAGADGVDTAISTLSGGSGHCPTEALVEALKGTPRDTGLDQAKLAPIAEYFREVRLKYKEFEGSFTGADTRIFLSQVPGGMLSNLESQLKQMGLLPRMAEVLAEVPRVRADMGYIPLVTPTSQIVGTQAVMNVAAGERYKMVPQESKDVFAGKYGATPAPMNPDIQKKVLGGIVPITERPANLIPNELDKLREEVVGKTGKADICEDEVLSYALFPKVWETYWQKKASPPALPAPPAPAPASLAVPVAPAAAPTSIHQAPARTTGSVPLKPGRRLKLGLQVDGKPFTAEVEVLG